MPYCSRCGVEVDATTKACVLCGAPIQVPDPAGEPPEYAYPPRSPARARPVGERRTIVWELSSGLCGVAAFTLGSVDLVGNGRITWSAYPLTGIGIAWAYTTIALFLITKPWIATAGWIVSTVAFVAGLNAIDTTHQWFLPLALPLTLIAGAALATILFLFMRVKSVTAIVATLLATTAFLCLSLDFMINCYLGHPGVGWSVIVSAGIAPLEGILAFHAAFLRKRIDLRRFFDV